VLTDVDPAVRVRLGKDRMTGRPRGFAFAEFSDAARAADAIRRFDAFELNGRRLRVNDADDKPPPRAPRLVGAAPSAPMEMRGGYGGGPGGGFAEPAYEPSFHKKGGSRRGLRAKKRSLR
jgi:RNA recognition motif-containing protein